MSQTPEKILAIDPGERTGWATGESTPDGLVVTGQGVAPLKNFAVKLGESFENYDTVLYETWRLYANMAKRLVGNDMQPSQLVGMIRYISWLNPSVKLVSLGADVKKTAEKTAPDEIKERLLRSSEEHDKDALLLLWFYHWREYV